MRSSDAKPSTWTPTGRPSSETPTTSVPPPEFMNAASVFSARAPRGGRWSVY